MTVFLKIKKSVISKIFTLIKKLIELRQPTIKFIQVLQYQQCRRSAQQQEQESAGRRKQPAHLGIEPRQKPLGIDAGDPLRRRARLGADRGLGLGRLGRRRDRCRGGVRHGRLRRRGAAEGQE